MSEKKIRVKVSELRVLIREALAPPITSRQSMIVAGDDEDDGPDLGDGKGKEQLNDVDAVKEDAKVRRESRDIIEFTSYEQDFAEKLSNQKYEAMAKQIFDAWGTKDVDVDWAGVVNIFARNHSKNLGQEVDKTKLYEKVLDLVEAHEELKNDW